MAEETKSQEQKTAQSSEGQAAETKKESETAKETGVSEQQYKDLQAKLETEKTRADEAENTLEIVQPYVDFKAMDGGQETDGAGETGDSETYASKKEVQKQLQQIDQKYNSKLLVMQFKADHPDLKPYEKTLVIPTVVRLRKQHPTWTADKLIEEAAKSTRQFLKDEHDKANAETKAKEDEAKQKAGAAGGFSSTQSTPSKTEDDGGQTNEEYLAERQASLAKNKGQNIKEK